MKLPVEITYRNMEPSAQVERRVQKAVDKLEQFHERIMSCHVVVEAPDQRRRKGGLYRVSIDLRTPGRHIGANRDAGLNHAHEDVLVAIRDAFDAARRRLEDVTREDRGDVKHHEQPVHGKVSKLFADEGYGFVVTSEGQEIYFHANSVVGSGFRKLAVGDEVRLEVAEGESDKGPQASTVHPVGKHHIV